MTEIIVFDTETTGLPDWKAPSGGENQPHIVQLAAHQVDVENQKIIQTLDVIVKPDGWEIPQEVIDIHGITNEYAHDVGIPEPLALDMFLAMWNGRKRVAFNTTFDNRIIRIATKRYSPEPVIDAWKSGEYECAMIGAKKAMSMPKNPTLEVAYKHLTGKELENAHTAIADVNACLEVYFAIKAQEAEAA